MLDQPVLLAVLLIGLLIATIRDIQVREVPDLVSYGLVVTGVLGPLMAGTSSSAGVPAALLFAAYMIAALAVFIAVLEKKPSAWNQFLDLSRRLGASKAAAHKHANTLSLIAAGLVLASAWHVARTIGPAGFVPHLQGLIAAAAIGVAMVETRQWGGGDAKLLMGVGAIIGLSGDNLLFGQFLILLVLCGAAYGLLWTAGLALIHRKQFLPAFKARIRTRKVHRMRIALVASGILSLAAIMFVPLEAKLLLGTIMLFLYLAVYSWVFTKTVEETVLLKEYPVTKLTEGDWVTHEVKVGRRIIVPEGSTGITKEQIALLQNSPVRKVTVKEGIPFVPGFTLAFLALLFLELKGISLLGAL